MSYQVLARKLRPSNFSQVAGQGHVLKSLINALDNQRLHHAYLFTGTRGVGKTTLARILAKCLNCEEGITSTPCETCSSCKEISEGRFIDLIEVDAASKTKIDDTRELLDNVQYLPSRGRFKVYLIDEMHMLSNHSFNALLKTLEEPPSHVKFLLATTNPQKLPITILSRCLQFNLKNLGPQLITKYLTGVLGKEEIKFEKEALLQIATVASGSMRDALTLVDQSISYCKGSVTTVGVVEMLGVPAQKQIYELLKSMASQSISTTLKLIQDIAEQTPDYGHTLDGLLSNLHRIALTQINPNAIGNSDGDKAQITELASLFTAEDVQLYYQMGLKGREDIRLSAEIRTAFEMLLIRMLVFSPSYVAPVDAVSSSATESSESPEPTENEKKKSKIALKPQQEESQQEEPQQEEQKVTELDNSTKPSIESPSLIEPVEETEIQSPDNSPKNTQSRESPRAEVLVDVSALDRQTWLEIHPQLTISGIAANVLANSDFLKSDSNNVYFVLDHSQSAVFSDELLPKISQALSDYFSVPLMAHIEVGETQNETPALLSQRLKEERRAEMVNDFECDENVQELLKRFSGTLEKESIAANKD